MRYHIKSFLAGSLSTLLIIVIALSAYAAVGSGIKSADYNDTKILFNGKELDIESFPMITVVKENETFGSNYMPLRRVLSEMGYGIVWNGNDNSVLILSEDYLGSSNEWMDFESVSEIIKNIGCEYLLTDGRIMFLDERQSVHVFFDARHDWDIKTAVIGDKIYVDRGDINNFFNLYDIPPFLSPDEIAIMVQKLEEFENNIDGFVRIDELSEIVNSGESEFWIVWQTSSNIGIETGVLESKKSREILGSIEIFIVDHAAYVRKADINIYLAKLGYGAIE